MNRVTGALLVLVAAGVPSVVAQAAPSVPTASLAIVNPSDASQAITDGDENTQFVVRPPDGASCPGDTRHDGWQLAGFILPEEEDPATQIYTALGPVERYIDDVTRRLALYRVERSPVGLANLPLNDVAGKPARIPAIPTLSFQQVATLGLAGGRYQLGIACVFDGTQLGDYWTAIVTITRPTDLKSTELSWTVEVAAPAPESSDSSSTTLLVVAVVVGAAAIGFVILRLRKGK
ncbi:MAG: hypothetical protein K8R99_02050 [Actinomycetia bacterium]|nr:hypothetical protein [Actinomycetes bacterium]